MAIDLIWDAVGQKRKLWEQTMLLAVPALSPQFRKHSGEKTPLEKAVTFLRIRPLSYLERGIRPNTKKRVGGRSPPPTHNFACSLLSSPPKQDPIFNMKKHHFGYIPNDMSATCHPDTYMSVVWTLFLTSQNPTNTAKVLSITKRM